MKERQYTIERVFFNNHNEIMRKFDYKLEPMTHHEAVTMLNKLYNKFTYDYYNCIDRIKEVTNEI